MNPRCDGYGETYGALIENPRDPYARRRAAQICQTCPLATTCLAPTPSDKDWEMASKAILREMMRIREGKPMGRTTERKNTAKCGTDPGYYRHRRALKEDACPACIEAHRIITQLRIVRKRQAAA